MAGLTYTTTSFEDLNGWAADDHQAALDVFLHSSAEWTVIAASAPSARVFFEEHFQPVLIEDGADMVFTGYFEPELNGSREKSEQFHVPVYALPQDPSAYSRRQIDEDEPLEGQGLEIAWLSDPIDLFFLQVQGSGRICLPDGSMMRVGFAGKNGRDYTSIGKILIARGVSDVNPDTIRAWLHENGAAGLALLWENESYVFFREISQVPADQGPIGAMGKSITASRSIAVDPNITPLGSPVWIERVGMERLMVAQDTGSAIKGAQRADIFFGTGAKAGALAGQVNDGGRMIALIPHKEAQKLIGGMS
ncbi:murein transglycosylase [Loktanella sp. D2R18]|uniref:murein transglycosylase A n=1 Tax=Rhodobacterales TaxID=204455 RepID=UPI000DEB4F98|nr:MULTISPECIES: MltA domain-containing protein [Rhodobacterales]MDO6590469.1 MltA domain-containing protein [Yoonia sp. 1_MG-2023]RBW41189.1 murein transglycosylase [Loktanella sp. D2R18]